MRMPRFVVAVTKAVANMTKQLPSQHHREKTTCRKAFASAVSQTDVWVGTEIHIGKLFAAGLLPMQQFAPIVLL